MLEGDRLEQEGLFAGHSVLQQLKNLLPGHAPAASSPASPKPASFEVKSLGFRQRAE